MCTKPATFLSFNQLLGVRNNPAEAAAWTPVYACMDWTTGYIAKPHSEIGRPGVICPRVPSALKADSLYFHLYHAETIAEDEAGDVVRGLEDAFLALPPTQQPQRQLKALLLVLPRDTEAARLNVEQVQRKYKEGSLKRGILLGKFHSQLKATALNNPHFSPGRSPFPILALRYAVAADVRFMLTSGAPSHMKIGWIHAYLDTMDNELAAADVQALIEHIKALEKNDD